MNIYIALVWIAVAAVSRYTSSDAIVGTIVVVDGCWRWSWLTILRIVLVSMAMAMLLLVIIVITVFVAGVSKCRIGGYVYLWLGIQRWVDVHGRGCDVIVFNRNILSTALLGCRAYPGWAAYCLRYLAG